MLTSPVIWPSRSLLSDWCLGALVLCLSVDDCNDLFIFRFLFVSLLRRMDYAVSGFCLFFLLFFDSV